jgi:hypothetical protein
VGHYASETPGSGWDESIDRTERALKRRELLQDARLQNFKVRDLPVLLKIMGVEGLTRAEKERLRNLGWEDLP